MTHFTYILGMCILNLLQINMIMTQFKTSFDILHCLFIIVEHRLELGNQSNDGGEKKYNFPSGWFICYLF